ncbi:MAG: Ig-like domain-containing protein, partial [Rhodoplanes sp.]
MSLAGGNLADGRITLSFDWNFISGEAQPALTANDFAVFTVTDGVTAQVYKLADARQTSAISDGWRMSVYDVSAHFALPARGDLKLTLGFAVLNDQTPDNPSRLLVDNVRLNRPIDAHQELVRTDGSLLTYRECPEAGDDAISTVGGVAIGEDTIAVFGGDLLLANDRPSRGADGAAMKIVELDTSGTIGTASLSGGGVAYDPRGRFDFLSEGQTGTDTFRHFMSDANGGSDQAEVTITVIGRNDAPSANADSVMVEEGGDWVLNVLANDDDVDSDDDRGTLRIVAASAAATGALVAFTGVAGAGLVYRPSNSGAFAGLGEGETAIDTISYTIEDSHGVSAQGSALVTVVGRNDAPTARHDQGATDEDTMISLAVLSNDTDPDVRDQLVVGAVNGTAVEPGAQVTLVSGAIIGVGADGTLRYDPASGLSHLARGQTATDTFSYSAWDRTDGHGGASTANVSVTVSGRNDAPIAVNDVLSTNASSRLTVAASTLLSNDIEVDAGDRMTLIGIDSSSTLGAPVGFDGATVSYDP